MDKVYIEAGEGSVSAAAELSETLQRLFANILLTGSATEADYIITLTAVQNPEKPWESVDSQRFHILCDDGRKLSITAASSVALFWGVCELTSMWGITHLVSGDCLPERSEHFSLPVCDKEYYPRQRIREWRLLSDFLSGGEGRSLEGQRKLVRQLAKMKVNSARFDIWLFTPFLTYSAEYNGEKIEKKGGELHCGQIFEVREGSISSEFVSPTQRYINPSLAGCQTDDELNWQAHVYLSELIKLARSYGMQIEISFEPFDYPAQFAPLLEEPVEAMQLGKKRVRENADLLGEKSLAMINMSFDAMLSQYPDADVYVVSMPEHGRDAEGFEQSLDYLDSRFGIRKKYDVEKLLDESDTLQMIPGGEKRGRAEGRMTLQLFAALYRVLDKSGILERLTGMGKRIAVAAGVVAPVMIPVYADVLAPGVELISQSYTASRSERTLHSYDSFDAGGRKVLQIMTFQDDNIGGIYQSELHSLSRMLDFNIEHGISGYSTRFWPTGDLDEVGYCLSEASWRDESMNEILPELLKRIYGSQAQNAGYAFSAAEDVTLLLDATHLTYLFQSNNMVAGYIGSGFAFMDDAQYNAIVGYSEAEHLLRKAAESADISDFARARLEYLAMRMYFSKNLINELKYIDHGNKKLGENDKSAAAGYYELAIESAKQALLALSRQLGDDNDTANLVIYEQLCLNEVKEGLSNILTNK